MQEILFRGISRDTQTFVFGDLLRWKDGDCDICVNDLDTNEKNKFPVYPETVGEFTGMVDKNGKRIFEGDIARGKTGKVWEIRMYKGCWAIWDRKAKTDLTRWDALNIVAENLEIIGSIHENPELLKEGG